MKTDPDNYVQSHKYTDQVTGLDLWSNGLTKREYFAACAMQGLLSSDTALATIDKQNTSTFTAAEILAVCAVLGADELIKALNRKRE